MKMKEKMVNILIIENDDDFRLKISRHLRQHRYIVFDAVSKSEIKEILCNHKINIALIGLGSLKKNGLIILKMIKKISPATETITLNYSDQLDLSIESMKSGAFYDLLIPFDWASLMFRIRKAYEKVTKNS